MKKIAWYKEVLESKDMRMDIIKKELMEVKDKYGDVRRSEIVYASEDLNQEDFYADDEMIITVSHIWPNSGLKTGEEWDPKAPIPVMRTLLNTSTRLPCTTP